MKLVRKLGSKMIPTFIPRQKTTCSSCSAVQTSSPSRFEFFCNQTTLHGWNHLVSEKGFCRKTAWLLVVIASIGASLYFAFLNIDEFINSGTVTSIKSMTAPLSDIEFPAITLCNVNPVSGAFLRSLNITTIAQRRAFFKQYIRGDPKEWEKEWNQNENESFVLNTSKQLKIPRKLLNDIYRWNETNGKEDVPIARLAAQNCSDMIIHADFRAMTYYQYFYESFLVATDYGICCWMHPKLDLEWYDSSREKPPEYQPEDFLHVPPGAMSGIKNGFKLIVDVEGTFIIRLRIYKKYSITFVLLLAYDYSFHGRGAEGFRIALSPVTDLAMMNMDGFYQAPGEEAIIALHPTIINTTERAVKGFDISRRDCYSTGEFRLKYLNRDRGFKYSMSNCLYQAFLDKVMTNCSCIPTLILTLHKEHPLPLCKGKKLSCEKYWIDMIGFKDDTGLDLTQANNSNDCPTKCRMRCKDRSIY